MFYGQYTSTIDQKGRIALPKPLRAGLTSDEIILTEGFDGALFGFDKSAFEAYALVFLEPPLTDEDARVIRRRTFSAAQSAKLDDQGRCLIAQRLLKLIGYTDGSYDVVVIGAGDHFEIWPQAKWQDYQDGQS